VVSMANASGRAREVMTAVWNSVSLVKKVTIVDDDIDPWDPVRVEWAIATRMKADRDLVVVAGARTDRSEPLKSGGTVAKLGIDATRKAADREDWTRAAPPAEVTEKVRARLSARREP
jgi:2,5-furandicarboxylate decarboxylase 1